VIPKPVFELFSNEKNECFSSNYDELLNKFLINEENGENWHKTSIKPLKTSKNQENLEEFGTKLLKNGLFSVFEELKYEENSNNSPSIAKEIFKTEKRQISFEIKKNSIENTDKNEEKGQVFIDNFMNLINNAITQISQNIVKNLEKPTNQMKNNEGNRGIRKENSKENSEENSEENSGIREENPSNERNSSNFFNFPRIASNFTAFPKEISRNLKPINPQKLFEEFDLSSEISKNQSEIKESEENESRSEGEMTGIVKESRDFTEEYGEISEENEIELSEGEIRL